MALSPGLRRLYIARDADAAGDTVQATLAQRAGATGIETIVLSPRLGDFHEDLHVFGFDALSVALRIQLAPEDVDRCRDLGGPCDAKFAADSFEEIGKKSEEHVMEKMQKGDAAHLSAASSMRSATPGQQIRSCGKASAPVLFLRVRE
ncbi:hypothetical protein GWG65_17985 [Bradyrhizobium sp. CSA207]|nr:hypothetical protein [Bradyrhizobium sp. CSA207]